jgi:hypothetical protein
VSSGVERTSVTTDAEGRRVVAKVASTPEEAARLENEAALLEAARHPGVVALVGLEGHGVGSVMLTAHVDGATLGAVGRLPLEEAAGVLAALASTLADLHDLGLVHGAMCPEHVLIGPTGGPVLCSLGYGGRTGEPRRSAPPLPPEFADPAPAPTRTSRLAPEMDVFGLGALARWLAPSPPYGHALGAIASQALAPEASDRPSARSIAETLHRQVPSARLPRALAPVAPAAARPAPSPADPLQAWRERGGAGAARRPARHSVRGFVPSSKVLAAVAVGGALVVAMFVIVALRPGQAPPLATATSRDALDVPATVDEATSGPPTTRTGPASPSTTSVATTGPSTTVAARPVAARRDCPPITAVLQADVDGDGCPDAMHYADGILEAGGRRWSLGQVGDQVATGDWGCQGGRTVALFRPATGEIFRFDGWASPARDLQAKAVARVDGGSVLRAADLDGDGCHEAVVERGPGLPVEVVRLPAAQP